MLEVQFQPADVRKKVRYFFLPARKIRWLLAAAAATVMLLGSGAWLLPGGLRAAALWVGVRKVELQRGVELRHFAALGARLGALEARLEQGWDDQAKLALLFGAADDETFAGGLRSISNAEADVAAVLAQADALAASSERLLGRAVELGEFVARHAELTRVVPSICPLPGDTFVLSSPYGERRSPFTDGPSFHAGIDLAARTGTPVVATADGQIAFAGRVPLAEDVRWWRMGNCIVIDHDGAYVTVYAHLDTIRVSSGRVRRGDLIATVGSTGWSTSPHLHYEVRRTVADGQVRALDPRIFILNYEWKEPEARFAAARRAPAPECDPLPSLTARR